jgi:hypothetical protein
MICLHRWLMEFSITNVEDEISATVCIKQIRTPPPDKKIYVCRVVFCCSICPKDTYCCKRTYYIINAFY